MRILIVAAAALALCTAAHAGSVRRPLPRVFVVKSDPYWVPDYNIVPRYRYRPQDDRVDTGPNAPPVAPGDVEPGGYGIGQ
jgi:hypothetical protein